jgi:hypothetical protein
VLIVAMIRYTWCRCHSSIKRSRSLQTKVSLRVKLLFLLYSHSVWTVEGHVLKESMNPTNYKYIFNVLAPNNTGKLKDSRFHES